MSDIINYKSADIAGDALKSQARALVDFWAAWCGPCRMLAPSVEKLAAEFDGKLTVGKVNIDEEGEAASALGIASIPTLIFFKNGVEADRLIGAVPYPALKEFVERNLV